MERHPQVSITTLLYNSANGLSQCLQAIRPAVQSGFVQMLAVDNARQTRVLNFVAILLFIARCAGSPIATR